MEEFPGLKNVKVIEKHLEKNEKWLQYPENKIRIFEKNAGEWNNDFLKNISEIEKVIHELEKKLE
ncbi:hypothetical protein [Oceanobacillus bengalensis]|uniref:Uncharacterized protein n=1 Tax=Oceanobacillus bengalensis TaxID=1435466 RepID=A0A494YVD8_9BACI|nr:hypothetical protein [Oceanobacillus bengalensis]RKQ14132.1 hypothetical protein D8M05_13960 [Oceanobacillus bengalensis]